MCILLEEFTKKNLQRHTKAYRCLTKYVSNHREDRRVHGFKAFTFPDRKDDVGLLVYLTGGMQMAMILPRSGYAT